MKRLLMFLLIVALVLPVSALESDVICAFWDGSQPSPTLSRVDWDNNTISAPNFNSTFPWREMVRDNTSQTWFQNQTLVKIPAFKYQIQRPADNITRFCIYGNTSYNETGMPAEFTLHPAFYVNQSAVKSFYMSAYEGSVQYKNGTYNTGDWAGVDSQPSQDKLSSIAGVKPASGANNTITMAGFRNLSQSRGMNWEITSFNHYSAIQLLYLIEYSSFYSQSVLSAGVTQITDDGSTNMAVYTGCTAGIGTGCTNLGNASGQATITHYQTGQTTYPMSYRGIENVYGNQWKWVSGINIKANSNPWIANYSFAADTFSGSYQDTGLTLPSSNGYGVKLANNSILKYGFFPSQVDGSSSTYITDYYFQATGNRAAMLGGRWGDGAAAGAFDWALNSAASGVSRSFGARLDLTTPAYANFTYTQSGNAIYFSDLSYNVSTLTGLQKNVTSWNWSFGDGNVSTLQNPSNIYPVAGTYAVNLTVSDGTYSDTYLSTATYLEIPVANFTASPTYGARPLAVTFSDASSGSPTSWYWDFGDGNTSVLQNPSHIYDIIGNYSVNFSATNSAGTSWFNRSDYIWVTNATGFNQQDVTLTPSFTVTMHITDSTTGAPIPVVLVQDSNLQEYTTANGTAYFTEAYGTVVFYLSATGYTSKAASYIIDEDRTVTVQMVPAEETTISNWYTPWQVRIRALDYYGTPLPRVNITAYYVATSLPSTDTNWLTSAFGINEAVASDMVNSSAAMMAETDDDGGVSFVMFKSLKYRLVISNATQGVSGTKSLYPNDQQYDIRVAATGQKAVNNTLQAMGNTSLPVYQLNATAYNLSMIYRDTTGMTTNVVFMVKFRNGTTLYSQNLGNPGTTLVAANYTVINPGIGQELIWMFNATKAGV